MTLISIKRVVATSVIHRKAVSSGKKVASCKTIIKARTWMFSLKKLITVRIIWAKVTERFRMIVTEVKRSEALFAFYIDEMPITGDCGYIEEISKFVHRKIVSMLWVVS